MDPVGYLVVSASMTVIALAIAGVQALRRRRDDAALPPVTTVAAARPGQLVRIVGTVAEGPTMSAPITGRACVCFSAAAYAFLDRRDGSGTTRREERERYERVGAVDFVVDDGTARIAVESGGLLIRADLDHRSVTREYPKLHDPTLLPAHLTFDELQVDEGIIAAGTRVVLEGVVQRSSDGPDGAVFRADASTVARLVPSKDQSTSVTNLPVLLEKAARGTALAHRDR
jgi:hypothetical protein